MPSLQSYLSKFNDESYSFLLFFDNIFELKVRHKFPCLKWKTRLLKKVFLILIFSENESINFEFRNGKIMGRTNEK